MIFYQKLWYIAVGIAGIRRIVRLGSLEWWRYSIGVMNGKLSQPGIVCILRTYSWRFDRLQRPLNIYSLRSWSSKGIVCITMLFRLAEDCKRGNFRQLDNIKKSDCSKQSFPDILRTSHCSILSDSFLHSNMCSFLCLCWQ